MYQGRPRHAVLTYCNKGKSGLARAKRLEAKYATDPDLKKYSFKRKVLDPVDTPSSWWDENMRRVEGNWKSQYKVNRQYNIHSSQRDSVTIRRMAAEEYTYDDIDEMLEDDFLDHTVRTSITGS